MVVQELDRVLDGEDVLVPGAVDVVEERGEGRRLAGAGRPGDEHEAARLLREVVQAGREAELLERLDLVRDEPEGGAHGRALKVGVDTEAREAGNRMREVDLPARLESLLLLGREDPVHERPDLVGRQRLRIRQALEAALDADHRRRARRQVEVRRVALDHDGEQVID